MIVYVHKCVIIYLFLGEKFKERDLVSRSDTDEEYPDNTLEESALNGSIAHGNTTAQGNTTVDDSQDDTINRGQEVSTTFFLVLVTLIRREMEFISYVCMTFLEHVFFYISL